MRTDEERLKARTARLAFLNLTPEDQNAIYEHQEKRCPICLKPIVIGKGVVTDHCHKTGLIRGIPCFRCNKGIGYLGDDPVILARAVDYLACPPATAALGAPRYGLPGRVGTKKQRKLLAKLKRMLTSWPSLDTIPVDLVGK